MTSPWRSIFRGIIRELFLSSPVRDANTGLQIEAGPNRAFSVRSRDYHGDLLQS